MFKRIHLTLFSTKCTHFKFDACYRSQKSWHGGNKGLTFFKDSAGRTSVTGLAIKKSEVEAQQSVKECVKRLWNTLKTK